MTSEGLTTILAYLDINHRKNYYLSNRVTQLTLEDISKNEMILDEEFLEKLEDKNEIDKFITTNLIDDAHFFNEKLKDNIFGNSLKEVIKKKPKKWMKGSLVLQKGPRFQKQTTEIHSYRCGTEG